jgi:hypothetical protein
MKYIIFLPIILSSCVFATTHLNLPEGAIDVLENIKEGKACHED